MVVTEIFKSIQGESTYAGLPCIATQIPPFEELGRRLKQTGGTLHLIGLVGNGGVHAIDSHLLACLELYFRLHKDANFVTLYPNLRHATALADDQAVLKSGGLAIIHRPSEREMPETIGLMTRIDERTYGRSIVDFYRKS